MRLQRPRQSWGSMSKDDVWGRNGPFIIQMPLQLLVLLTYDFIQPDLFLGKCQDSASRTTVPCKSPFLGRLVYEPQWWHRHRMFLFLHFNPSVYICGMSEGIIERLYRFDLLALSSLLAWRFTNPVLFNIPFSGKNNSLNWNLWTALCVFWHGNFRLVSTLISFLLI